MQGISTSQNSPHSHRQGQSYRKRTGRNLIARCNPAVSHTLRLEYRLQLQMDLQLQLLATSRGSIAQHSSWAHGPACELHMCLKQHQKGMIDGVTPAKPTPRV